MYKLTKEVINLLEDMAQSTEYISSIRRIPYSINSQDEYEDGFEAGYNAAIDEMEKQIKSDLAAEILYKMRFPIDI